MQKVYTSILLSFVALLTLTSCVVVNGNGTDLHNQEELDGIAAILEADPQAAYGRLEVVNVGGLSDSHYHYYVLLLTKALDHTGVDISSFEEKVLRAKDYFIAHSMPDRASLACFELARVYEAQGNDAKTLYFYQQADRWATKAGYAIPSLTYAKIPYNIAKCLVDYGRYDDAIGYLTMALDSKYNSLMVKQYMFELKGICYDMLRNPDSAAYCYHSAMKLAEQNGDKEGKRRIAYNSCMSFIKVKDYPEAERRCNELLPVCVAEQDSLRIGRLYMVLARIDSEKSNTVQAVNNMQQSERYLSTTTNNNLRLEVLDMLAKIYRQSGNATKAEQYRRQHAALTLEVEQGHAAELEQLQAELKAELSKQKGEGANQLLQVKEGFRSTYRSKNWIITLLFVAIFFVALAAFAVVRRHDWWTNRNLRAVCAVDVKVDLSRRNLLNELLMHIFDNPNVDRIHKLELLDKVQQASNHIPTVLRYRYKGLHKRLKKGYPDFTPEELTVCWYMYTAVIPEEDIPVALGLEYSAFESIKRAVLAKMGKSGTPVGYYERQKAKNSKPS